jgi:cysteine desulfurase/selenocysteine lyase
MGELAERYRDEFPVKRDRIYFNHAGICPLPQRAAEAAQRVLQEQLEGGASAENYRTWTEGIKHARQALAKLTRAAPEELAFVKNTTSGLFIAAGSIPWKDGDNIVTTAVEFPANVYPWLALERQGVETRFVGLRDGCLHMDDLVATMGRRTRAVAVSWVQFSNGFRADLGKLSQLCRDRNCYLVIDAIQGLGALQLDLSRYAVDFASADGHKWLLSVEGCGILYVRRQILNDLVPFHIGWMGVQNAMDFVDYQLVPLPDARRFEEGSYNVAGIHALGASAGLFLEAGAAKVEAEIMSLTDVLMERLEQAGCLVTSPRGTGERSGIVTFQHPQASPGGLARYLNAHGVQCAERAGSVRFSPHFYNDESEVERAVALLGEALGASAEGK